MSTSAQAASHRVLTITRIRLAAMGTGGQNRKRKLASGDPPPLLRMPRCSPPASGGPYRPGTFTDTARAQGEKPQFGHIAGPGNRRM
jgi:hypothetical protein